MEGLYLKTCHRLYHRITRGLVFNILGILIVFSGADPASAQRRHAEVVAIIDGDSLYQVVPPDAIPAILNPDFVSGKEAADQMSTDEAVMGIILNGEAKAYSLWQLDHHEIVNDFIGGIPIAVTW